MMDTTTTRRRTRRDGGGRGVGVDIVGGPVVDPTENVIALSEASNRRQDDLRGMTDRYLDVRIKHVEEMAKLRAEHAREITELESNRLNAIRQVDQLAVNTAADRAAAAIQALAATTTANAENLRNALTATAATIAAQNAQTVAAITERLAALEKAQYEGTGRARVADPMMAEFVTKMDKYMSGAERQTGKSEGVSAVWAVVLGVAALIGVAIAVIAFATRTPTVIERVIQAPVTSGGATVTDSKSTTRTQQ